MKYGYLLLLILMIPYQGISRCDSTNGTLYTHNYEITEGIYYSYEEFICNSPGIATSLYFTQRNLIDEILFGAWNKDRIIYYDTSGIHTVPLNVWAVVKDGTLYIEKNGRFHKVEIFGAICHFVKSVPKGIFNIRLRKEPVRYAYHQYILDMQTGQLKMYNLTNMKRILERDAELYSAFEKLDLQYESLFRYLLLYNSRHPVYFCNENAKNSD